MLQFVGHKHKRAHVRAEQLIHATTVIDHQFGGNKTFVRTRWTGSEKARLGNYSNANGVYTLVGVRL